MNLKQLIDDLTEDEKAELLADYRPTKLEAYKQALKAATADPTDGNIITVMLLKVKLTR